MDEVTFANSVAEVQIAADMCGIKLPDSANVRWWQAFVLSHGEASGRSLAAKYREERPVYQMQYNLTPQHVAKICPALRGDPASFSRLVDKRIVDLQKYHLLARSDGHAEPGNRSWNDNAITSETQARATADAQRNAAEQAERERQSAAARAQFDSESVSTAKTMKLYSLIVGQLPGIGTFKAVQDIIRGSDGFTGEKVERCERAPAKVREKLADEARKGFPALDERLSRSMGKQEMIALLVLSLGC